MILLQSKALLQIVFSDAWISPIYICTKCMNKVMKVGLALYIFFLESNLLLFKLSAFTGFVSKTPKGRENNKSP